VGVGVGVAGEVGNKAGGKRQLEAAALSTLQCPPRPRRALLLALVAVGEGEGVAGGHGVPHSPLRLPLLQHSQGLCRNLLSTLQCPPRPRRALLLALVAVGEGEGEGVAGGHGVPHSPLRLPLLQHSQGLCRNLQSPTAQGRGRWGHHQSPLATPHRQPGTGHHWTLRRRLRRQRTRSRGVLVAHAVCCHPILLRDSRRQPRAGGGRAALRLARAVHQHSLASCSSTTCLRGRMYGIGKVGGSAAPTAGTCCQT
jgi:hypothetical protein